VLTGLLYRLLCHLVRVLVRGGGERELEIVVLRHQLAILRRGGKRPRYTTVDRALLAAASRLLPCERWSCFAVSPRTLRRWHQTLLEGGWRGHRRRLGRPPLAAEMRDLICRMARENPRWGYMRIQGELLKLGIGVSATTIATVLRVSGLGPAPRRIGPSWSEFLRAQAQSMLGGELHSGTGASRVMPPGRADYQGRERLASWRLTATSSRRPPLPSLASLLTRSLCGAARHGRTSAFSLRLEHHRACRQRNRSHAATDPSQRRSSRRPAL
jgi:Homeodomain-like domain